MASVFLAAFAILDGGLIGIPSKAKGRLNMDYKIEIDVSIMAKGLRNIVYLGY